MESRTLRTEVGGVRVGLAVWVPVYARMTAPVRLLPVEREPYRGLLLLAFDVGCEDDSMREPEVDADALRARESPETSETLFFFTPEASSQISSGVTTLPR